MRILITGGFGYIGGRLAQFLDSSGNNNIILGTRKNNIKPGWLPNSEVLTINWASSDSLSQICNGVDVVIHLASMNAQESNHNPMMALEFNLMASARLLHAAVEQKVKKFIYFSTAHVYDSHLIGDINEGSLTKSLEPYATTHRAAEDVVLAAHASRAIECVVIRLSNSFGAPAHADVDCWTLLVNDLCKQLFSNNKMVLRSSGLQRRDFITMTDVCRATLHLMNYDVNLFSRPLFNLGGAWSPSVWEMTKIISQIYFEEYGVQPKLIRKEPSVDEKYPNLIYNIELLKSTGFTPEAFYEREIRDLLKFCKKSFT